MKLQRFETPDYILAVSDEEIKEGDWVYITLKPSICQYKTNMPKEWCKKIIAYQPKGNAPELDLPLLPYVEDDVEKLPYDKLCYYDTRNSDFQIKEEYGYDKEEVDATGEFPKKDCACDNCFYGRAELADRIIKTATKVYSDEDLRKAIDLSRETLEYDEQHGWYSTMSEDEIIKSLKQPKTPKWFVAEIETVYYADEAWSSDGGYYTKRYSDEELKTTTINGKSYLVGTYLYE
jgi:hypothetical protein